MVTVTGPAKTMYLAGIEDRRRKTIRQGGIRHPGDVYAQSVYAFDKAKRLLAKHGATMADIIKITAYLVDVRDRDQLPKALDSA